MRYAIALSALLLTAGIFLAGCSKEEEVPSGTYEGTIEKVNADEHEIYVKTGDGKVLELYFTDETKLGPLPAKANFAKLAEGVKVKVQVENRDGKLIPIKVDLAP